MPLRHDWPQIIDCIKINDSFFTKIESLEQLCFVEVPFIILCVILLLKKFKAREMFCEIYDDTVFE